MQPIRAGKLRDLLPEGHELWLDGGHNAAGAQALHAALVEMNRSRPAPLVLISGMMASKDAARFFQPFADMPEKVVVLPIEGEPGALDPQTLAEFPRALGLYTELAATLSQALLKAAEVPGARIVVCGSLYLAGNVLAQNKTPPK